MPFDIRSYGGIFIGLFKKFYYTLTYLYNFNYGLFPGYLNFYYIYSPNYLSSDITDTTTLSLIYIKEIL